VRSAYLSAHLQALRTGRAHSITVSAGDLTGASPLLGAAFEDEPTIQVMNLLGLEVNAVGNHELDNGVNELLRLQYGGCGSARGTAVSCATDGGFAGANFEYLAANVEYRPGQTVFPRYVIRSFDGADIAFVGMTLSDRSPYSASGIKTLTLDDEIATVNALVPELQRLGVAAIVVLVHQGDSPPPGSTYDACNDSMGPAYTMAMKMDPAVDAIVSAHTHRAYNCTVNGKLLTSAASYGRVITEINLHIDRTAAHVASKSAQQHLVTRDITPDPAVNAVINTYLAMTRASADVDRGYAAADISNFTDPLTGQSAVGDVIADGMLASVANAQVALMNVGGVRDGIQAAKLYPTDQLTSDGVITFEKLKTVQPFANKLTSGLVSAADLKEILEEQWKGQAYAKILQIAGLTYHYSVAAAAGSKITAISVGGVALDLTDTTRNISVVTNEFISGGGDGFVQFKQTTFAATGAVDVDVTAAYTSAHSSSASMTALPIPSVSGRVFAEP
jgi:5'-nucleotidase